MPTLRNIYRKAFPRAGKAQQAYLAKLVFELGLKPSVMRSSVSASARFPNGCQGGLVISADFEMAWAFRYSKRKVDPIKMASLERGNLPQLLEVFDTHQVPVTWATVGHLFLRSCQRGDHDWMRRIPHFDGHWKYIEGDWFDHDPYTDSSRDSAWYAPDLVELILNSGVAHEFGCHTFSHLDCSDAHCPPEVLEDEIKASAAAALYWGITLRSFVFPGGTAGNYRVLRDNGFKIYRRRINHDIAYPFTDQNGLLVTASTSMFGKAFDWSAEYYVRRYRTILEKAMRSHTIAHLWLHPSVDAWTLKHVIPEVLKLAASYRDQGKLWIGTMGQLAELVSG